MNGAAAWYWRSALLYTVGGWTVFGCVIYWSSNYWPKSDEELAPKKLPSGNETSSATTISKDGLREITTYSSPERSFSVNSVTIYKPNFVPYSTRLYNYVQSFFDHSGGKEK